MLEPNLKNAVDPYTPPLEAGRQAMSSKTEVKDSGSLTGPWSMAIEMK